MDFVGTACFTPHATGPTAGIELSNSAAPMSVKSLWLMLPLSRKLIEKYMKQARHHNSDVELSFFGLPRIKISSE